MQKVIAGPVFDHLEMVGLDRGALTLATAFYSAPALATLSVGADSLSVFCRLDFNCLDEWIRGYIAPEAMLLFLRLHEKRGATVSLYCAPSAHAKVYAGHKGAIVGSANLTMNGFGGGLEVVAFAGKPALKAIKQSLNEYRSMLNQVELDKLEEFVRLNETAVALARKKLPPIQDRLPKVKRSSRVHLGTYGDFLEWLLTRPSYGAAEIRRRAYGKSNLSGHIDRNFHGLRQFFVAYPQLQRKFEGISPDSYKLSKDPNMEKLIAGFVKEIAVDEAHFSLERWLTYLPTECGGRADKHGGTIGNLNYMLPLVASYLRHTLSK